MKGYLVHKSDSIILFIILLVTLMGLTGFTEVPNTSNDNQVAHQILQTQETKINPDDLETFTDATIQQQLEKFHIAGATVAIVQDGTVKLAKSYGYADVNQQIPVSPGETLFRIGSTSKLFIWTAVMQLAEQGKIDLSADINRYLPDFQIPATYPTPITMLNLLSHTSGFEDRATGTEAVGAGEIITLHDYLANYMPDRVRPAGELTAYSNYGAALAGYIVEVLSGMPFDQYVETNIFQPLSMSHSTFRQPLPPPLDSHLAVSYSYHGQFIPGSFTYVNPYPAATVSTTAQDMSNFIIAHLQDGRFENNQLLKPETLQLMHSRLFSNDERLDGLAYGFFEETANGQRILWHSGDIGNWHSILTLIPEQKIGFFVGYNSNESISAVNEFYYAFLDAFFPAQATNQSSSTNTSTNPLSELAGFYRSTRSIYNHIERVSQFPGNGYLQISINPDSTLNLGGTTYYEKGFLVYSTQDGSNTLIFRQDANGKITHVLSNGFPLAAFERIYWYETPTFNLLFFGTCYFLLLTTLVVAIIRVFKRRKGIAAASRLPSIARIWAFSLSVVFLVLPVIINIYLTNNFKTPFPFYMVITLAGILAASVLVIGSLVFTIFAWTHRYWNLAGRLHYTAITLALVGMVWITFYWRLLGFRF
ncbi:MAG: serine hydrolase [Anaerolineaceae bacterium]|nr:serine hydrolase [Anaerolineaceae bacterium]